MTEQSEERLEPGRYRHFKGGEYAVFGEATHLETGERVIVYLALYGEQKLWVRPYAMFAGTVTLDGQTIPRFVYCGSPSENRD